MTYLDCIFNENTIHSWSCSDGMLLNYICLMSVYGQKKKHHQLRRVICGRCRLLSHGHMITAVGGNGGYSGGKQFISAEELREKLSHLRYEKALIVKLVSLGCLFFFALL